MSDSNLSLAVTTAKKGFKVFPIKTGTAIPAIKEWPLKATTDERQINLWWSGSRAQRNVGIACSDTIVVLDVDVKDGKPGRQTLKELVSQGLPKTCTVQTPSGGYHLYFQHPGKWVKSVVNHWPGVDVRGNGGQVVAPGSTTPKGAYSLLVDAPIAKLPENFQLPIEDLSQKASSSDIVDALILDSSPYSDIPAVVKAGERDDYIFKSACSWRERGYSKDHAFILMAELYKRVEQPPGDVYPFDEALKKVEQAWANYAPASNWTQVITPQGPIAAPTDQIKTMQEAIDRFVFIIAGQRVADLNRAPRFAVMKLEEFKNAYRNIYIGTNALPTRWLNNRNRQTVRDTIFYPKTLQTIEESGEQFYNTYTPSGLILPAKVDQGKVKIFLDHVRYIMGSDEDMQRFIKWCAVSVQLPWLRIPWMPVIITTPRCGKGLLFKALQKVVGDHNTSKVSPAELEEFGSGYNAWLSETVFVCIEEIKTTRKWDVTERLKAIITEDILEINHKHGKKGNERIFANLIAFTNHRDAVAVDDTDGRFWIVYNKAVRQSADYYKQYFAWLDSDGPAHLELFLKQVNIQNFDWASPPPMTAAKQLMIDESMSILERQLRDAIEDKDGPFRADIVDVTLVEQYLQSQSQTQLSTKDLYQIRHMMHDITEPLKQDRYRVSLANGGAGKRYRCRALRNVEHWRKASTDAVAEEYKRAWLFSNGHNPQPDLKEVEKNVDS